MGVGTCAVTCGTATQLACLPLVWPSPGSSSSEPQVPDSEPHCATQTAQVLPSSGLGHAAGGTREGQTGSPGHLAGPGSLAAGAAAELPLRRGTGDGGGRGYPICGLTWGEAESVDCRSV